MKDSCESSLHVLLRYGRPPFFNANTSQMWYLSGLFTAWCHAAAILDLNLRKYVKLIWRFSLIITKTKQWDRHICIILHALQRGKKSQSKSKQWTSDNPSQLLSGSGLNKYFWKTSNPHETGLEFLKSENAVLKLL